MSTPTPNSATPAGTEAVADPRRPWKAYVTAALGFVTSFALFWISDEDPFTAKEAAWGVVAALTASGLLGGTTYAVKNPIVAKTPTGRILRNEGGVTNLGWVYFLAAIGVLCIIVFIVVPLLDRA